VIIYLKLKLLNETHMPLILPSIYTMQETEQTMGHKNACASIHL